MPESTLQSPPSPKPPERPRAVALRPKRSFGTRLSQSARAWLRSIFEREQMIAGLKSLAWVAPITVVIWIYAEREETSQKQVQFRIEGRNNDPDRIVELRGLNPDGRMSTNFTVRAMLDGRTSLLDREAEALEGGGGLKIELPENLKPGENQISLASILATDPTLQALGLTPTNVLPAKIDIFVDPIVHKQVRVMVRSTVTNLDGPVHFKPDTVEVTGPQSLLNIAQEDGKLVTYADLPNLSEPGSKSAPNVPLTFPISDSHIHLSVASVSADYTVKNPAVEGTLHGVPILAAYPPGDQWEKLKAQYEPTLPDLKVIGPADVIEEVSHPDSTNKPKVMLDLSRYSSKTGGGSALIAGTTYEAPLIYEFGNAALKPGPDSPKTLTFTVVERKAAADN